MRYRETRVTGIPRGHAVVTLKCFYRRKHIFSRENFLKMIYELLFKTNETFPYNGVRIKRMSIQRGSNVQWLYFSPHSQLPCSGHCRDLDLVSTSLPRAVIAGFYLRQTSAINFCLGFSYSL